MADVEQATPGLMTRLRAVGVSDDHIVIYYERNVLGWAVKDNGSFSFVAVSPINLPAWLLREVANLLDEINRG